MLHALAITLTLAFGRGLPTSSTFDIRPVFYVEGPTPISYVSSLDAAGMALPYVIFVDESYQEKERPILRKDIHGHQQVYSAKLTATEEYMHTKQMQALGPAFYPLYFLTAGRPFEPYRDGMWLPEGEGLACSMFRFSSSGSGRRYQFLPCYSLFRWTVRR